MKPILQDIKDDYPALNIEYIDVERNDDEALEYKVRSLPTILFIKDGAVVERYIGTLDKTKVETVIDSYYEGSEQNTETVEGDRALVA